MMRAAMLAVVAIATVSACGGSTASRPTATLTPAFTAEVTPSPTSPPATEILRLSDEAMNGLSSLHEVRADSDRGPWTITDYRAPDAAQAAYEKGYQPQWCRIGNKVWTRGRAEVGFEEWELDEGNASSYSWPNYDRVSGGAGSEGAKQIGATEATNVRVVDEVYFGAEAAWVITYEFMAPSIEGPYPVQRMEWISKESYYLLQQIHSQNDPFGFGGTVTYDLSRFNDLVDIVCDGLEAVFQGSSG